jgi:thymidylate synthase
MNNTDRVYQDLLKKILTDGTHKGDRTGTGTISIPAASVEFDMAEGFPLLTTKKMFTKGIIHELLWFLNGDTNIKYLVRNGVNIWTPDAYREYCNTCSANSAAQNKWMRENEDGSLSMYTIEEFKEQIINDDDFAERWGDLGPVYGHQWVDYGGKYEMLLTREQDENGHFKFKKKHTPGLNQIAKAMNKLIDKPDDRRNIVMAWNLDDLDKMALPPCHYDFHLYTEELSLEERTDVWFKGDKPNRTVVDSFDELDEVGKHELLDKHGTPRRSVSLIWDQRSVDTFLGLPFNIASYGILLHMFAQQANMVPDKLIGHLKNVHIYENHVEQCKEQISREPRTLPKLELAPSGNIFNYKFDNVKFTDYNPHPTIKGKISV